MPGINLEVVRMVKYVRSKYELLRTILLVPGASIGNAFQAFYTADKYAKRDPFVIISLEVFPRTGSASCHHDQSYGGSNYSEN